ncbi:hypothetical protein DN540_34645, partial [Burkholderia multivorans]
SSEVISVGSMMRACGAAAGCLSSFAPSSVESVDFSEGVPVSDGSAVLDGSPVSDGVSVGAGPVRVGEG